jgi:undecaprenyl pyrophosphate synthase
MWSAQRTPKFTPTAIAAVAIAAGTLAVVAPHPDTVIRASNESELAHFLATAPQPLASDFGETAEGQNTY